MDLLILLTTVSLTLLQVRSEEGGVIGLHKHLHNVSTAYKNLGISVESLLTDLEGQLKKEATQRPLVKEIGKHFNTHSKEIGSKLNTAIEYLKINNGLLEGILRSKTMKSTIYAKDCSDLYRFGKRQNGVYSVFPVYPFVELKVYCDMETDEGGWTVFHRRGDFSMSIDEFSTNWNAFKTFFGDYNKEFYLGNENIHSLTSRRPYSLRVDLWDKSGTHKWAKYTSFNLESENASYALNIGNYSGNAGDSLSYHNKQPFSSKDNFKRPDCTETWNSGWWYRTTGNCFAVNLNNPYIKEKQSQRDWKGISWNSFHNGYSLSYAEMKMRPDNFK